MIDAGEAIVVLITTANKEQASQLAGMLVGKGLAACVQILPQIESVYRWQGEIERQQEVLIIAKTVRSNFEQLQIAVRQTHSYEIPEIVALPIVAGSRPYLEWLSANVSSELEDV
jgi:periplasmic divalent cation tolerance protein